LPRTATPPRPRWLVKRLPAHAESPVPGLLDDLRLATVCRSAKCPNLAECWARKTATLMILGTRCTRDCGFCAVGHGEPAPVDPGEPARVAEAAKRLGLGYVVVTSVTRDDLPDGGAAHFAATVRAIHGNDARAEVLVPDFAGDIDSVHTVCEAAPEVFGHNIETVPRLYPTVRPGADYARSLSVLEAAARFGEADGVNDNETNRDTQDEQDTDAPSCESCASLLSAVAVAKSGLMLGLGETREEVEAVMRDLRAAGVGILTLGQYLRPGPSRVPVAEYVEPGRFDEYARVARELGFAAVAAGPFVRSSYRAEELFMTATLGDPPASHR